LTTNDAVSLGMHPSDHQKQQAYFDGVVAAIDTGKKLLAGNTNNSVSVTNTVTSSQILLAQNNTQSAIASSALPLLAQG